MAHEEMHHVEAHPVDAAKIRKIWTVAGILALVTTVEFILAFTMQRGLLLNGIFILLTLVKAFYIVAEFMHLKHEVKSLVFSIVIPIIFVLWLILALLIEGSEVLVARF